MKDIDFDELDKAVNSLMATAEQVNATPDMVTAANGSSNDSGAASADSPASATATIAVEPSAIATADAAVADEPSAKEAPVASAPTKPSLAIKRSGRFMDVVHPSSDMRTADKPVASHSAATITPVSNDVLTTPSAAPEVVPHAIASEPELPSSNPIQTVRANTDALETAAADEISKNLEALTVSGPADSNPVETPEAPKQEEPLSSPFLPDAKVEKRPLGNPISTIPATEVQPVEEDVSESQPTESEDGNSQVSTDATTESGTETEPKASLVALPEELQQDVAAIEATVPNELESDTPLQKTPEVAAGGSIAQQYKEAPAAADTRHEALYDSAAKAAPLAHPAKKKSGWSWVLWTLLLILLGAGGAAAVYYLKLL